MPALDPSTRAQTRADLGIRLRAFAGIIILVSHDPLHAVARRSSGVHRGWSSVQEGTPKKVIAKPRVPYVAQVVGLNFLRGQRVGDQRVDVAGVTVVAPEVPSGATVCVTIPPSANALYRTRPQGSPHNTWPVTVSDILPGPDRSGEPCRPVRTCRRGHYRSRRAMSGVGQELWATVKATEVRVYPA